MERERTTVEELERGILAGDRALLGRAITLVESRRPGDRELAGELLQRLLPETGSARRVGITGVPGVGKSTFIETLGTMLTGRGHRVAVLAVDPSSQRTGGSILGDKTRMPRLAVDEGAFIRPSPSAGTLGGVTRRTRETLLVCEAAGYDVVLVETVGAGQSETAVADMVDFFLVLMLAGAGDDLQGIKRGVLEIADLIAVNKADGDNLDRARAAAADYRAALRILGPSSPDWSTPVVLCSGLTGEGLDGLWEEVERHREVMTQSGGLEERRSAQRMRWFEELLEEAVLARFWEDGPSRELLAACRRRVAEGELAPGQAVRQLLETA